jgi:hypothetical protein
MRDQYVPFRPVYARGDCLVASDVAPSSALREAVKAVLAFYDVPYREDDTGALLIPESVAADRDTVWNYTTKANDPVWLRAHVPEDRARWP